MIELCYACISNSYDLDKVPLTFVSMCSVEDHVTYTPQNVLHREDKTIRLVPVAHRGSLQISDPQVPR